MFLLELQPASPCRGLCRNMLYFGAVLSMAMISVDEQVERLNRYHRGLA